MILQIVNTTIVPKQRLRHNLPQEQNSHWYDNVGKTNDEARLHWVKQIGSLSCQKSSSPYCIYMQETSKVESYFSQGITS